MALPTEGDIEEQKYINEEYKVWKKNSLVLYNSIYTYAASLTLSLLTPTAARSNGRP
jgi:hypothetical protein